MADLLGTGISGLLASRVALDTTGHNIANLNTDGYSRQRVDFNARTPQGSGRFFIGQGVDVTSVQRTYSQYLTAATWTSTSAQQRSSTFNDLTGGLNDLLAGSNNVQTALDSFYGAVQDAANDPASTPTRQALLGKATSLAGTLNSLAGQLDQVGHQVNARIGDTVEQINRLASGIADLNGQIRQQAGAGGTPNDLLDKRDALIKQLSADVHVTVSTQDDNAVNVFAGNGQPLVAGNKAYALTAGANPYNATRTEVYSPSGTNLSAQLDGGSLGALLDYRSTVLEPARNQLGRAATAFATTFNAQHAQGMDLDGNLGGQVFSISAPQVLGAAGNTGSGSVSAAIGDLSALGSSDYVMSYDGSNWSLATPSGQSVAMTGTGTAADPFVANGLSFTVGGSPASGDSVLIQPTRNAAGGIKSTLDDPAKLALAAPLKAAATAGNAGTAAVGSVEATDIADPALLDTTDIAFTSATTYTVNGAGSYTYTPGSPIQANGWSLSLDGTPATGDSFTVRANSDGAGDNRNALALGQLADTGVLDNGATSAGAAYGQLVANVGTVGAQANIDLDAQNSLANQATQMQQSVSGVNLEEEGANLIRYQQSYQAAAQVISTASTIFDTLLNAVRS